MWLCWGPLAMEEKEGVLMDIAEKQQCLLSLSLSLCHTHTHTHASEDKVMADNTPNP